MRDISVTDLLSDLPVEPDEYALELLRGVEANCDDLDRLLSEYSEHWAVERMPAVDRAVLRLGVYELLWAADVDDAVAINEAVELAKQLSTDDSPRFVNGVLDSIARIAVHLRAAL